MRFLELELDRALALDPQARGSAGLGLVRPIAGNPVTMGEMTRHVPDAGSYAPVTILKQELPVGGTRLAYDSVASDIAIYDDDRAATEVAENRPCCVKCLACRPTRCPEPVCLRGHEALATSRRRARGGAIR